MGCPGIGASFLSGQNLEQLAASTLIANKNKAIRGTLEIILSLRGLGMILRVSQCIPPG